MRRALASATLALLCIQPAAGGRAPLDVGTPPPARTAAARVAVATGSGEQRFVLWTAKNSLGELCLGWRLGAATIRPPTFQCLRHGLERPMLWAEGGGGLGGQITWGALSGVASPQVTRISVTEGVTAQTERDLVLAPLPGFPGWHAFTTGIQSRPPSLIDAYGRDGPLFHDSGIWIHPPASAVVTGTVTTPNGVLPVVTLAPPPVNGQLPPASGPSWTDTFARLGADTEGERATTIALALPTVRNVLTYHPAWIERAAAWNTCGGRPIGNVVSFRFASPASFTAVLPMLGPAQGYAYAAATQKIRANGWTELNVFVDTNAGVIAGVNSRPYEVSGFREGTTAVLQTLVPLRPGGGRDDAAAACSHD